MHLRGFTLALFLTFVVAPSSLTSAQVRSGSSDTTTTAAPPSVQNSVSSENRGRGSADAEPAAFSTSVDSLRATAATAKADKEAQATVLLNEESISLDDKGKITDKFHFIYRVENEDGVKNWADISSQWESWHQLKPEIRARIISPDGAVHELDPKTLTDVPVHEDSPDTYSDERAYGGPLPAITLGAIVEEEIVTRDTAPFFAGGLVQRLNLGRRVPVEKIHIVLSHPESLAMRYVTHEMPDAKITKTTVNGIETVDIENGRMEARSRNLSYLPADVIPGAQVEYSWGGSWRQVAAEYARLSNDKLRVADVQSLLASLKLKTSGSARDEVITSVVSALHKNVRYTGVEFGEASIIPQFPAEVLKRKYGDCKDKAALLVTMLHASGIPASLALLDTGPGQDVNPDLPGMGLFDHAIVYVPASGQDPERWIDATAQYSRVGELPYMDYGRWALIVNEKTTTLKKIPDLTASANLHREFREFALPEFGQATIVEKNQDSGPGEAGYRETYASEDKDQRQSVENYLKNAYLAEKLITLDHNDPADLSQPFWVSFTTKGKRGSTDYLSAVMAIRVEDLFNGFPDYFTSSEEDRKDADDGADADKDKPRTKDWQIRPFTNEWDYKIVAPVGYKLRALPHNKEEQVGAGRFTQQYTVNADGTVVQAVLRFESGKSRLTVAEAKDLRDAVMKARKSDPIFIAFDSVGQSLIASGNVKDGLASYQQLIQMHPKEALHRVQLARALVSIGLGEQARGVAREATLLEPNSAQAYSTLGWILEHDLIGRIRKKGFDYDGAVAAYRKAKLLDPKDKDLRANLAILLEFDANGERYTPQAHLKEAVTEFTELKKLDKDYAAEYDDNVLYDLWYAGDMKGLDEAVRNLPITDVRRGFVLAASAAEHHSDAAIKKALEITTDEATRNKALTNAGSLLLRMHKYSLAADLLAAGARGQENEAQSGAYANVLRKALPRDQFKIDSSVPQSIVQHFYSAMFTVPPSYDQIKSLMSKNATRTGDEKKERQDFSRRMTGMRLQLERTGLPLEVLGDIALPNMRFSVEGNGSPGYKITAIPMGTEPQQAFVVRENGTFKLLEMTVGKNNVPEHLGWQALEELGKNDLSGARQWLDWAREQVHINDTDDPLAGQPFPHFWTKGQEGDAVAIRTAALVLAPSKELRDEDIAALIKAGEHSTSEEQKGRIDLVLADAYRAQERWSDLLPIAERLTKAYPDSLTAFGLATAAYAGTGRLDDWKKLLDLRLPKHSDELEYTRSAATLALYRGDFARSRELLNSLMDRGKATASDMNSYAWDDLFISSKIDQDAIEAAERANQITNNTNFAIMHTLACLDARAGKPVDARALLLKAMDAANLEEPDSSVWLAYGVIAEEFGATDAARTMYARVEKLKTEVPTSNYQLAQQWMEGLGKAEPARSASAAR